MAKQKNNPAPANQAAGSEWDSGETLAGQAAADVVENPAPEVAPVATAGTPAPEVAVVETYPDDLKKSFALLAQVNQMPTRNEAELLAKNAKLKPLKAHIFALQQGSPVLHLGADHMSAEHKTHGADVKRKRLEILARENIEVRELLAAHDTLKKEVEALRKQQPK